MSYRTANVVLMSHTPDPIGIVARAAKVCVSYATIEGLQARMGNKEAAALIKKLLSMGHHSPFEHANFTFGIEGVSRAFTHQLVRHRLASYSQQSQRYFEGLEGFVIPPSIDSSPKARELFDDFLRTARYTYNTLLEEGIKAEDARFVLPNAATSRIVTTMNARELRHFFSLRCCSHAQWEIREVANKMLGLVRQVARPLFEGAGPPCAAGKCPEGPRSCGKVMSYTDNKEEK